MFDALSVYRYYGSLAHLVTMVREEPAQAWSEKTPLRSVFPPASGQGT